MNGRRGVRTAILWFSVLTSLVSLAVYVWSVVGHRGNPFWNRILLTYSLVFWIFLAFDEISRRTVVYGADRRASVRPRPLPPQGGSDVVLAPGRGPTGLSVRLVRVTADSVESANEYERMVREFAEEIAALEQPVGYTQRGSRSSGSTQKPNPEKAGSLRELAASGNPILNPPVLSQDVSRHVQAWLTDGSVFPFWVEESGQKVGACVVQTSPFAFEISLLYIRQDLRRLGLSSICLQQVHDFVRLLGVRDSIRVQVSKNNTRAARFLEKNGYGLGEGRGAEGMPDAGSAETASAHKTAVWFEFRL